MLSDIKNRLDRLIAAGKTRELIPVGARKQPFVEIKGRTLLDFTSWDFLNLNENPKFKRAAQTEIESSGIGVRSSRFSGGNTKSQLSAERRISLFLGTENTLIFSTLHEAISAFLSTTILDTDMLFVDEFSLVQDLKPSRGSRIVRFRAENPETLETELKGAKPGQRRIVLLSSLSPITASLYDLPSISKLCERYFAELVLDESMTFGVLGLRGAGASEHFGLARNVLCFVGDLSLGFGCYGAFVSGPRTLLDYLTNVSRESVERGFPSPLSASVETAVDIMELKLAEREKLALLAAKFKVGLGSLTLQVGSYVPLPISCLLVQTPAIAFEIRDALFAKGFLVEILDTGLDVTPGGVIRFLLNTSHTDRHIESLLQALSEVLPRVSK